MISPPAKCFENFRHGLSTEKNPFKLSRLGYLTIPFPLSMYDGLHYTNAISSYSNNLAYIFQHLTPLTGAGAAPGLAPGFSYHTDALWSVPTAVPSDGD